METKEEQSSGIQAMLQQIQELENNLRDMAKPNEFTVSSAETDENFIKTYKEYKKLVKEYNDLHGDKFKVAIRTKQEFVEDTNTRFWDLVEDPEIIEIMQKISEKDRIDLGKEGDPLAVLLSGEGRWGKIVSYFRNSLENLMRITNDKGELDKGAFFEVLEELGVSKDEIEQWKAQIKEQAPEEEEEDTNEEESEEVTGGVDGTGTGTKYEEEIGEEEKKETQEEETEEEEKKETQEEETEEEEKKETQKEEEEIGEDEEESEENEEQYKHKKKRKSTNLSFEELKQNATYENIVEYVEQQEATGGEFSEAELEFLKFYLVGRVAAEDYANYLKDPSYTEETYGNYKKGKNDCYTYANIKIFKKYENDYWGANNRLTGTHTNTATGFGEGKDRLMEPYKFLSFSRFSTLYLQAGDVVGVNLSPNNTGNNHWGIVVLVQSKETGQMVPMIAARGSLERENPEYGDLNELWTVQEFFQYARGVDVISYGNSDYNQHIEVDVSTMHGEVVEGRQPNRFTD